MEDSAKSIMGVNTWEPMVVNREKRLEKNKKKSISKRAWEYTMEETTSLSKALESEKWELALCSTHREWGRASPKSCVFLTHNSKIAIRKCILCVK